MKYKNVREGIFVERPNRFVAKVIVDGVEETVHVKTSGRCEELLLEGCTVLLEESDNEKRKTKYDLIGVYKDGFGLINIDGQVPGKLFREWLELDNGFFPPIEYLNEEFEYENGDFDYYFEQGERKIFIEVRGVNIERLGNGYFPEGPTAKEAEVVEQLCVANKEGYECYMVFIIPMRGVEIVMPNKEVDRIYRDAMVKAIREGVKYLFFACNVSENEITLSHAKLIDHL